MTTGKNGLFPASKYKYFQWFAPALSTDDKKVYFRIKASGKFCFLLAGIRNTSNTTLHFVGRNTENKYEVTNIVGNCNFYVHENYLIVDNNATWQEYSIIPLTGSVDEANFIDTIPEGSIKLMVR